MRPGRRPGHLTESRASLSLLDYRRRVADLYTLVRSLPPRQGHEAWRTGRDDLFRSHPQSPIPPDERASFGGLPVWEYDPVLRFTLPVEPSSSEGPGIALPHSGEGTTPGQAIGVVTIPLPAGGIPLTIYRLEQYGDHLFLPFVDGTAGGATYGGGRYLIDTAKGADLGSEGETIVIDFNFAFHPSCVHDNRWSCPLAPAANRFSTPIRAGERLRNQ